MHNKSKVLRWAQELLSVTCYHNLPHSLSNGENSCVTCYFISYYFVSISYYYLLSFRFLLQGDWRVRWKSRRTSTVALWFSLLSGCWEEGDRPLCTCPQWCKWLKWRKNAARKLWRTQTTCRESHPRTRDLCCQSKRPVGPTNMVG